MTRAWTIGRTFVLRHAGMPFDWVEELGAPDDLLRAADTLLDREAELLSAARLAGVAPAATSATVAAEPARLPGSPRPEWRAATIAWAAALEEYHKAFETADDDATRALRAVLARADVREAVFLSNPDVYRNMLLPFMAEHRPLNSRWRRVRRQLYTYVQRFCAKNETVSFFGPMAYGTTCPGRGVRLRTDVPRRRRVFFAHWAGSALAAAIAADGRLRAVLPLRRTGMPLPADVERDLAPLLGDGGASLTRIAAALGVGVRAVATRLQPLVVKGGLEFGLEPPPYELDPLGDILDRLAALGPDAAVAEWTARVSELRDLLGRLERAPFAERPDLIGRLEQAFSAATGKPARRGAGAVYADRAVFYEECASQFAVEIGEQTLRDWAKRITAALEMSTAHGAATQSAAARQVRAVLGDENGLSLIEYSERLRAPFDPGGSRFSPEHVPAYPAARHEQVVADLIDVAARQPGDRYALVDLCPAGVDVSRVAEGDLVLSRCHHHLLTDGWLGTMCPADHAFGADARSWVAGRTDLVGFDVGRRNKGYHLFPGRRVVMRRPSSADAADPDAVWPHQITVENGASGPRCLDQSGRPVSMYLPLSDYVKYPPYAAISHPQVLHAIFEGADETPAVTVDGVVYQRPRWAVQAGALSLATPHARFLQLRRLARERVRGRFVFCRTATERKPYLVDLASVLAADLVAHIAKDGSQVTAEQMLPAPDQLWLRDRRGRRYTCELRMQVVGARADR